ncbi:MAG TPA: BON domain-containing protein [Candidatus Angelobacter sp.]|nr:BON domain-containing protein [Candidatus Angelobacter sp.]
MKPIIALLLMSAAVAWPQQPSNQGQYPSSTSPAMAPESGQQPTPTPSRQDKASANSQIRDNISSALSSDPILSGTNVQVNVDDVNITLTGSVESAGQMRRVVELISPYIGYRQVVNKVQIR